MTTNFLKRGSSYRLISTSNVHIETTLPVGTYGVVQDPETGEIYLETIDSFPKLGKLYGDTQAKCERILTTFESRPSATGVLLSGEKGCGKTMLAKMLSLEGAKKGYPTIVVNKPFCGEAFNQFIQSITQPCVIIFDEYEKVYNKAEHQDLLLTLFDGVFPTKKLFILTSNERSRVNDKMLNRPGRIFYALSYTGLGVEFVREYCADNLKRKTNTDGVVQYSQLFEHFNFDMLKALVEEMNRYGETARQAAAMMNIKVESWARSVEMDILVDGKKVTHNRCVRSMLDPMKDFSVEIYLTAQDEKDDNGDYHSFSPDDLVSIKESVYTFHAKKKFWIKSAKKDGEGKDVTKDVIIVVKPATYKSYVAEEIALAA